jgi:hypothetical protein
MQNKVNGRGQGGEDVEDGGAGSARELNFKAADDLASIRNSLCIRPFCTI